MGSRRMAMVKYPQQFAIYLISLDPTVGAEMQKTRPCVIISPNEMNKYLNTVIIAPMTTVIRDYPTRIMENQNDEIQTPETSKSLQQQYQEALLKSGINAASFLNEIMELKLMPDPRAKEMADVALELIKIINCTPENIIKFKPHG
jgi:mRNA-degrading endonuclease toxin of MazEF toxin-antitoxin module